MRLGSRFGAWAGGVRAVGAGRPLAVAVSVFVLASALSAAGAAAASGSTSGLTSGSWVAPRGPHAVVPRSTQVGSVRVDGSRERPSGPVDVGGLGVRFSEGRPGASVSARGATVSFELLGPSYGSPRVAGDVVTYARRGEPTVRYRRSPSLLKEDVVLHNRAQAGAPLVFEVDHPGLTATQDDEGGVSLSRGGSVVFSVGAPFAVDAEGTRGAVRLARRGSRWTYTLDAVFARTAVLPVTMDPSTGVPLPALSAAPSERHVVKLADDTVVSAFFDAAAGSVAFQTAPPPYSAWSTAVAAVPSGATKNFAVVADGADDVVFAYRTSAGAIRVVRMVRSGSPAVWAVGSPTTLAAASGFAPNLVRSPAGTLAVSYEYRTASVDELHLATSSGGSWVDEVVAGAVPGTGVPGAEPAWSAPAFLGAKVVVVYQDTNNALLWQWRPAAGGSWSTAAPIGGVRGNHFSVTSDASASTLYVARYCTSSLCPGVGDAVASDVVIVHALGSTATSWTPIGSLGGTVEDGPVLSSDGDDRLWALYTVAVADGQQQLLYSRFDGSSWTTAAPLNPDDRPFNAAYKFTNTGAQWQNATADVVGPSGAAVLAAPSDALYVGHSAPFRSVGIDALASSPAPATLSFAYWDGSSWAPLSHAAAGASCTAGVCDSSSMFSSDGRLGLDIPAAGAAAWQKRTLAGPAPATASLYWLRVVRTSATGVVPPLKTTPLPRLAGHSGVATDAELLAQTWSRRDDRLDTFGMHFDAVDLQAPVAATPTVTASAAALALASTVTDNYRGVATVEFGYRRHSATGDAPWHVAATWTAPSATLPTSAAASGTIRTIALPDGEIDVAARGVDGAANRGDFADAATTVTVANGELVGSVATNSYDTHRLADLADISVNRYWGNVVARFHGGTVHAAGPTERVELVYNSRRTESGPFGFGWTLRATASLDTLAGGDAVVTTGDGARQRYDYEAATSIYTAPAGVHNTLVQNPDTTWALTDKAGTTSAFSTTGVLQSVTDRNGWARSYTYTAGRLTSITNPSGATTTLAYNAAAKVSQITDSAGRETRLAYTGDNLTAITDSEAVARNVATATTFGYDNDHRLATVTDVAAKAWKITYQGIDAATGAVVGDEAHLAARVTDPTMRKRRTRPVRRARATPPIIEFFGDLRHAGYDLGQRAGRRRSDRQAIDRIRSHRLLQRHDADAEQDDHDEAANVLGSH